MTWTVSPVAGTGGDHRFDPPGLDPPGLDPPGVDLPGMDRHGVDHRGVDRHGVDRHGVDRHGVDRHGVDRHGAAAAGGSQAGLRVVGRAARDLAMLVVPVDCAGCGRLDTSLCPDCRTLLAGPAWRCEDGAPRLDRTGRAALPVWTLTAYTGAVRELVVAWKDRGRADLTPVLAGALRAGSGDVARVLAGAGVAVAGGPVLVVPAPSSAAARRRRGADLTGRLAAAVATGCSEAGLPAVPARVLAQRRGARDQVGLGARARRSNVRGRVRWRVTAARPTPGRPVVLVDDVLTTGATLAACDDAVRAAGGIVVAGLTLAATPPPGRGRAPVALPLRAAVEPRPR